MVKRRFTTLLVERDFANGSLRKAGEAHIRSPFSNAFEPVAQSVEHVTFNHGVPGSIPGGLAKNTENISTSDTLRLNTIWPPLPCCTGVAPLRDLPP